MGFTWPLTDPLSLGAVLGLLGGLPRGNPPRPRFGLVMMCTAPLRAKGWLLVGACLSKSPSALSDEWHSSGANDIRSDVGAEACSGLHSRTGRYHRMWPEPGLERSLRLLLGRLFGIRRCDELGVREVKARPEFDG